MIKPSDPEFITKLLSLILHKAGMDEVIIEQADVEAIAARFNVTEGCVIIDHVGENIRVRLMRRDAAEAEMAAYRARQAANDPTNIFAGRKPT